jgi:transcriptional regulator GlxA family with amidase domain
MSAMRIAILLFDRLAALDAIGPYEVMRCVPGWEIELVGARRGEVRAEGGLGLTVDRELGESSEPDIVVVPAERAARRSPRTRRRSPGCGRSTSGPSGRPRSAPAR